MMRARRGMIDGFAGANNNSSEIIDSLFGNWKTPREFFFISSYIFMLKIEMALKSYIQTLF